MIINKNIIFVLFIFLGFFNVYSKDVEKRFVQETYFENTPYELNVYRIKGRIPDNTMLVIGGIQGNEPTGYLAADHYVDINLERGSLIMVPRANFNTIIRDQRGYHGDMNRKFTKQKNGENYEEQIVEILKSLIAEADVLLNLHEGSGFYRDTWISDIENPLRYGQSIIADADVFSSNDSTETLNLEEIAKTVITQVNKKIENPQYQFAFNNHNTFSDHTRHAEQRASATYYALSNFGIPAFGIESSKSISDIELKVRHQVWIINEFMKIFNIVPEVPRIYLEYPELYFVIVTINEQQTHIVPVGKSLTINKGDKVEINHIESNYERGLSVDILNYGTVNDYRSKIVINNSTKAIVRKDKFLCGEIYLDIKDSQAIPKESFNYLVMNVNDDVQVFDRDKDIKLVPGDRIKIIDTVPSTQQDPSVRVNVYGFVPQDKSLKTQDRGVWVDTSTDLIKAYSEDGEGWVYSIRLEQYNEILASFRIVLKKPDLMSIKLECGQDTLNVRNNETIEFHKNQIIRIVNVETSDAQKTGLQVNFKGFVGNGDGEDRNLNIALNENLLDSYAIDRDKQIYPIIVSSNKKKLGEIFIRIVE